MAQVEKGMVLLEAHAHGHRLWTVTALRQTTRGAAVRLLSYSQHCIAEASATFPDGEVCEPFAVFSPSARDLAYAWSRIAALREHAKGHGEA